jgi:hypothetical protein
MVQATAGHLVRSTKASATTGRANQIVTGFSENSKGINLNELHIKTSKCAELLSTFS